MIQRRDLTYREMSLLMHLESSLVHNFGRFSGNRLARSDYDSLGRWVTSGLIEAGRLQSDLVDWFCNDPLTHWVIFSDDGWALAHECRMYFAELRLGEIGAGIKREDMGVIYDNAA